MNVHFIAIGGAAMHNLAIALHRKGYHVTGSDDKINDPSRSRLDTEGLLPEKMGWHLENVHTGLDAVILGMHAREDNPELARAQQLGVTIYSYPEYIYNQSKEKKRVVIGGSHGKTSITAMILHVLQHQGITSDYMVGAQLDGFDCMVKLSDAPLIILEGDEYLSSPIDRRPKFHWYRPHTALLSGVAWDHINVFPTFDGYVEQFRLFAESIMKGGRLIYYSQDKYLRAIADTVDSIDKEGYDSPPHTIRDGITYVQHDDTETSLEIFGEHNLQNLNGARLVCNDLGVSDKEFYSAISGFSGAARRLELVKKGEHSVMYKDFAHSPSKLKATTTALAEQYPDRELVACMELHTFSSLNKEFLAEYTDSMAKATKALIYFNPEVVAQKRLEPISKNDISSAFGGDNLLVFENAAELIAELEGTDWKGKNLLMMSSGTFKGTDYRQLADRLIS